MIVGQQRCFRNFPQHQQHRTCSPFDTRRWLCGVSEPGPLFARPTDTLGFLVALHVALKDAVSHRLEIIESEIKRLESKYHLTFPDFKLKWEKGEIEQRYSYDVEKDYWEWEGLASRR